MTRFGPSALLLMLLVAGCFGPGASEYEFTRFSMGTVVEYTVMARDRDSARTAVALAHEEMERVSRLLWEDDSLSVAFAINNATDSAVATPEALRFLARTQELANRTGGAFDPTIKPVFDLYDFDADDPAPPSNDAIQSRLKSVGFSRFHVNDRGYVVKDTATLALATGAVAKGYAVDRAVAVLRAAGVTSAIVNAGGDLYCLGNRNGVPWRVGIRDPDDASDIIAVLHLEDAAVATSGDYQQFFEYAGMRYHHILDPANGEPARSVRSATVVAATTELADALATALFVSGPADGIEMLEGIPAAEGLVVDSSGVMHWTGGMTAYLEDEADPSAVSD